MTRKYVSERNGSEKRKQVVDIEESHRKSFHFLSIHLTTLSPVSHIFTPYSFNPYHLISIYSPLYHLTPSFNPSIISPRFYSFYKIRIIKLAM